MKKMRLFNLIFIGILVFSCKPAEDKGQTNLTKGEVLPFAIPPMGGTVAPTMQESVDRKSTRLNSSHYS